MARVNCSVSTEGELALAAATAKTVLQIVAPTNQCVAVRGLAVSFDGTSGAAEPGSIELVIQTSAGTMTSATCRNDDGRDGTTIQTTAQKNASAEPTDSGVIKRDWHMHPQAGAEWRWNRDEEIVLAGGSRLGVRVTMPAIVNCRARLFFEE